MLNNSQILDMLALPKDLLDNIQAVEPSEYQAIKNQVLTEIVNKIVYQKIEGFGWKNPFKRFDGRPINYGDTIENIYVETAEGYNFDKDATDPFTKATTKLKVLYATINYERQYQATIEDALFRRAVLNEFGLNDIISEILRQLTNGKNVEEYMATIACLNNAEIYGNSTGVVGSKEFEELDISQMGATEGAKAVTEKIIDMYTSFEQPSKHNNALGVLNVSNKENLTLIIKRNLYNSINLDFLAGVFNLEKTELVKKIIPIESFQVSQEDDGTFSTNGEDIGFVIIDDRAWDNHVALEDSGLIYNPKGKYTNHFMNLWKIIAIKNFHNAGAVVVKTE